MKIRTYKGKDCQAVAALFYDTVHSVNANDYTERQLFAWAPSPATLTARRSDLSAQYTLVAEIDDRIVGFGSISAAGYLDLLFVHKDFLRRGIATALCDALEDGFPTIATYASITAKPFFLRRGYTVVRENTVIRHGAALKNFEMLKHTPCAARNR